MLINFLSHGINLHIQEIESTNKKGKPKEILGLFHNLPKFKPFPFLTFQSCNYFPKKKTVIFLLFLFQQTKPILFLPLKLQYLSFLSSLSFLLLKNKTPKIISLSFLNLLNTSLQCSFSFLLPRRFFQPLLLLFAWLL